jgi:hypothetical protein
MLLRGINSLVRWFLALLGMMYVLFEEVLWRGFGRLFGALAELSWVAWIENRIRRLPPILALPLFVLPWLIMLPVKLGALWLIAIGKITKGVLLFVGGEAFGVAFLARLYELCRPALHQWRWFVIVERILLRWTQWAHRVFRNLPPVRWAEQQCANGWGECRRRLLLLRQRVKPPEM